MTRLNESALIHCCLFYSNICYGLILLTISLNKLGLSRAELSQTRACLEVINLNFFELSTYHLEVILSFFGLGSEIFIGLANQKTFEIFL